MLVYHNLIEKILEKGKDIDTRNGPRRTIWGHHLVMDLQEGFPALTTKKLLFDKVCWELAWFLEGRTDLDYLHAHDVHIWDQNTMPDGTLGPIYGQMWRNWGDGTDQIWRCIRMLQTDPTSTRNVVSAWDADVADEPGYLPACHTMFQVHSDGQALAMQVYMRSVDVCLGLPFNIASYALLAHLLAIVTDKIPVGLIFSLGNAHIYWQHLKLAEMQIKRKPYALPRLQIDGGINENLTGLDAGQFSLHNYQHHPFINYELIP